MNTDTTTGDAQDPRVIGHFLPGSPPPQKDDDLHPFWEGTRLGELRFPRCRSCGTFTWYPQPLCRHCSSSDLEWVAVGGRGRLFTWTVVRFPFNPSFKGILPFIIALVEFEDAPGVRFVTNLVECAPEAARIGMEVEPLFHRLGEAVAMPLFRPIPQSV